MHRSKTSLGFDYITGQLATDSKIVYFGSQTLGIFSGTAIRVPNAKYEPKTSAELSLTYSFNKTTKITVGGTNIFNVIPSKQDPNETDKGFIYDSVQCELNGAVYFVRLWN